MKMLKNCIELSCSVKVYVPSTYNVNISMDNQFYVNSTIKIMSQLFGGATSSQAIGCWISHDKEMVKESVETILSYCKQEDLNKFMDQIYEHCLFLKHEMGQEAIALEVNNKSSLGLIFPLSTRGD